MSDTRAGLATMTINNVNYDVAGDLKADPTIQKNETLYGQSGRQGAKVMPKAGFIEATLRVSPSILVRDFQTMLSVSVEAVSISGRSYSGSDLTQVADCVVDLTEGTFPVRFEGDVEEG